MKNIQAGASSKKNSIGGRKRTENLPQCNAKRFKAANQVALQFGAKYSQSQSTSASTEGGHQFSLFITLGHCLWSTVLDQVVLCNTFSYSNNSLVVDRGPLGSLYAPPNGCPFNGALCMLHKTPQSFISPSVSSPAMSLV